MVINVPKGSKGLAIEKLSAFPEEKEILFARNQHFTINNVKLTTNDDNSKQWLFNVSLEPPEAQ